MISFGNKNLFVIQRESVSPPAVLCLSALGTCSNALSTGVFFPPTYVDDHKKCYYYIAPLMLFFYSLFFTEYVFNYTLYLYLEAGKKSRNLSKRIGKERKSQMKKSLYVYFCTRTSLNIRTE